MTLREALSAVEHDQWAQWAKSVLDTEPGISEARRQRWLRLINTPYADLTPIEKDQHRFWADKVLETIRRNA